MQSADADNAAHSQCSTYTAHLQIDMQLHTERVLLAGRRPQVGVWRGALSGSSDQPVKEP